MRLDSEVTIHGEIFGQLKTTNSNYHYNAYMICSRYHEISMP